MTKEIPLTKGYVALVDDADAALVAGDKWYASVRDGRPSYAITSRTRGGRREHCAMHRLIMNAPSGSEVDHINGNGLDNRRANLRLSTRAENGRNRGKFPKSGNPFKGVHLKKGAWEAYCAADGQQIFLGRFHHPHTAAVAYDRAAKAMHGDFARLNFSASRDWILPHVDTVALERAKAALDKIRGRGE